LSIDHSSVPAERYDMTRYAIFKIRSKADASQLNLLNGTENKNRAKEEKLRTETDMLRRNGRS